MGAGSACSPAFVHGRAAKKNSGERSNSVGGQASGSGFFGLRLDDCTGSAPAPASVRPAAQVAPQVRPAVTASSLSFGRRRAWLRFLMHCPVSITDVARPSADEFDGYGLARPSTPAMQAAARASAQRDACNWREAADLVASALND